MIWKTQDSKKYHKIGVILGSLEHVCKNGYGAMIKFIDTFEQKYIYN
jgi:hypothetical protein